MSSAAVIGRQLRQQQTTVRTPGPVVPPTQYRGRSNTNNNSINNNLNDNNTSNNNNIDYDNNNNIIDQQGADADSKFAKFSQQYNSNQFEFYPHPAHRSDKQNNQKKSSKKNKKLINGQNNKNNYENNDDDDKRFICTKHCFCVAIKAFSTGIILFLLGILMSIFGFFSDQLSSELKHLNNGTTILVVNKTTKLHLHNMTYVGPVIMGLGFIVIIAACILTFEVRDTLGIHDDPKNRNKNLSKNNNVDNCKITINNNNNNSILNEKSNIHQQSNHQSNQRNEPNINNINNRLSLINTSNIDDNNQKLLSCSSSSSYLSCSYIPSPCYSYTQCSSSTTTINSSSSCYYNQYYQYYCNIPSPVDIELSDPEVCSSSSLSLSIKSFRRKCSCSDSPTMIMSTSKYDQNKTDNKYSSKINYKNINMIASIDDLSSINSSTYHLDIDNQSMNKSTNLLLINKTSQSKHNNINNVNNNVNTSYPLLTINNNIIN